jgi:hypothetical protein
LFTRDSTLRVVTRGTIVHKRQHAKSGDKIGTIVHKR